MKLENPKPKESRPSEPKPRFQRHASSPAQEFDRNFQAWISAASRGLSPIAMTQAAWDWWSHLLLSPGKQWELWSKWSAGIAEITLDALRFQPVETSTDAPDKSGGARSSSRFASAAWQRLPYRPLYRMQLLAEEMARASTEDIRGLSHHHRDMVQAGWRFLFEAVSPQNFPWSNPEIAQAISDSKGKCLVEGVKNFVEDLSRNLGGQKPVGTEKFVVGRDVAVMPGKVVYRNDLMELIQYSPTTEQVSAEPLLIVPAWIMKYYILDLSPKNSMVRYLVEQGHTVFMISWRNPGPDTRNFGMDDYVDLGVKAALDAITRIVPERKVHAAGYCIGGTLLSIVAAALARDGDQRLGSITLFAAQTDFTEAGEIRLFIDESQVSALDANMSRNGYLEGGQMGGAFTMLRSQDLVWSRMLKEYVMGERIPLNDLMAWNADVTRMSQKMHSEYLEQLYVRNALVEGNFIVGGQPVALSDIDVPVFVVGTEADHVAPWKSVFKIHLWTSAPVTFVLSNGGHNSGIVNEPGRPRRHYRMATRERGAKYLAPQAWMSRNPTQEGSWWPAWKQWLTGLSGARVASPSPVASALGDAPGRYVLE